MSSCDTNDTVHTVYTITKSTVYSLIANQKVITNSEQCTAGYYYQCTVYSAVYLYIPVHVNEAIYNSNEVISSLAGCTVAL